MAKDWPYAEHSRLVKAAGGPEQYDRMKYNDGRLSTVPWIVGLSLLVVSGAVADYIRCKKRDKIIKALEEDMTNDDEKSQSE